MKHPAGMPDAAGETPRDPLLQRCCRGVAERLRRSLRTGSVTLHPITDAAARRPYQKRKILTRITRINAKHF